MLKVSALSFDYENRPVLEKVSFIVASGQVLHLRGRNGAGKTTLLKLLAGLVAPQDGQIYFDHQLIHDDLTAYQQNLCYIGHKSGLSSALSLRENYRFDYRCDLNKMINFDGYLQDFDLHTIADTPCVALSMGQRRRGSLLRLLVTNAKLWLLDEPFTSLDKEGRVLLMQKIAEHVNNSGMVIMTSHQTLPQPPFTVSEYLL